jgi:hypothetical protein
MIIDAAALRENRRALIEKAQRRTARLARAGFARPSSASPPQIKEVVATDSVPLGGCANRQDQNFKRRGSLGADSFDHEETPPRFYLDFVGDSSVALMVRRT